MRRILAALLFLWAIPVHAVVTHVTANGNGSGTSGTNSFDAVFSATNANDALIFSFYCNAGSGGGATATTMTSPGITTTQLTAFLNQATTKSSTSWGVIVPDTASHTYTVTFTSKTNCSNAAFWTVDEFAGNDTTGGATTFDANNGTTGAAGVCSLTVTPTNDNDGIWGGCWDSGGGVGATYTLGFAPVGNSRSEYKIIAGGSGVAQTVDWTTSGAAWQAMAATVKPAAVSVIYMLAQVPVIFWALLGFSMSCFARKNETSREHLDYAGHRQWCMAGNDCASIAEPVLVQRYKESP